MKQVESIETEIIKTASDKAVNVPTSVLSVSPILLSAPERGEAIQLRVSAPVSGIKLPIIIFAHGYGSSLDGYAPLVNFWAANGFVVIQPTFLDSRTLALSPEDPRTPLIWKFRVEDVKQILDELDFIADSVIGLKGRLDHDSIVAVGHSFGAQTTGMLLGARVINPDGTLGEDMSDSRIKVGVLLTPAGKGGSDLSPFAAEHFPFMNPSYAAMTTPTLVIAGDKDISPLTIRGWDWFTDAFTLSPGADWLVTLFGGEHLLGGISGYLVTETSDENPERVSAVQQLSLAYLRSALYPENSSWSEARKEFNEHPNPIGKIEGKLD
ncbi:alpha/beta fold hydrolase [Dyadobacter sp. CY356]|uniref:alpha/beta hydrolase family protein n=1 Tax=Dyadobacter sp. CY356 TaxID=2906442 RepID=UPI001F196C29|nr:alpha/beta fold hydrolase [Dyadobacter sp. CY356]MCF0054271.1 alpha/beta fold hydrolase [Dyadobacter sp. CY356]